MAREGMESPGDGERGVCGGRKCEEREARTEGGERRLGIEGDGDGGRWGGGMTGPPYFKTWTRLWISLAQSREKITSKCSIRRGELWRHLANTIERSVRSTMRTFVKCVHLHDNVSQPGGFKLCIPSSSSKPAAQFGTDPVKIGASK